MHGLHLSIMERLSSLPVYAKRSARVCMHLTKNYRSHPLIVKLLSKISYNNRLEPMAPPEKVNSLREWAKRETKQSFPMLFCGLEGGQEEQEGDSPSYFNRQEASTVLVLLSDLLDSMKGSLQQEEVGLISPFAKQTQKLRLLLRARGLGKVRVGSTEEFHGHEVRALFISTVRTSPSLLSKDEVFDTGFVGNVKRFNTALSRAVALLVVVGDAAVLSHAHEWRELIGACRENGSFLNLSAPSVPAPRKEEGGRENSAINGSADPPDANAAQKGGKGVRGRGKRGGRAGGGEVVVPPNYGTQIDVQALLAGNPPAAELPLAAAEPLEEAPQEEREPTSPIPEWAQVAHAPWGGRLCGWVGVRECG